MINLNSTLTNDFKYKYPFINLILDEIELYAHPDMQRKYTKEILDGISKLQIGNIKGINIQFITHSPFILSDIPKQNVLFLEVDEVDKKSNPVNFKKMNTFGANIHDLLSDSFFIGDGLIGEFAKKEITNLIDWLNNIKRDQKKRNYYEKLIELIDEPIMKRKLAEMYDSIFRDDLMIKIKKKELERLAEELNYNIKPKND